MRWICAFFVALAMAATAGADPPTQTKPASVFLIGNSLTWDTKPTHLDGDVQWHVDCGKSLPYIFGHPEKPCVASSTRWPQAMKKSYDYLSLQPHYGSGLKDDLEVISQWVAAQPKAIVVIHTGWRAVLRQPAQEYASTDIESGMTHGPAYFARLLAELRKRHPQREFRQTHAIELLARIARDVESGAAPVDDVAELYRDKIHMKLDTGRYLMHNAMRRALDQPPSQRGFEKLSPRMKEYLDDVLATLKRSER